MARETLTTHAVRHHKRRWRLSVLATAIFGFSFSTVYAFGQERRPEVGLLEGVGILMTHSGLDVQNNKIDALLSRFGFGCVTEGPLGSPSCPIEKDFVAFLRSLPANRDAIARELGLLGAKCQKRVAQLDCRYERRAVSTGWVAGRPDPVARSEELFQVDFTVTTAGKSLRYGARFRRLSQ